MRRSAKLGGKRSVSCWQCEYQQVQHIEWARCAPVNWPRARVPDVDDLRPHCCPRCGALARNGSRIVLHGHGVRERGVVVEPALDGGSVVVTECWIRRYRCTACRAVLTVLPPGVMPRFLYSALAIVMAFVLTASRPIGEGLTDAEAYDRQGMYPKRCWTKPTRYRWRSVERWAARIEAWWPGAVAAGVEGLLVELRRRAGADDMQALLAAAVASHVRWGGAM